MAWSTQVHQKPSDLKTPNFVRQQTDSHEASSKTTGLATSSDALRFFTPKASFMTDIIHQNAANILAISWLLLMSPVVTTQEKIITEPQPNLTLKK